MNNCPSLVWINFPIHGPNFAPFLISELCQVESTPPSTSSWLYMYCPIPLYFLSCRHKVRVTLLLAPFIYRYTWIAPLSSFILLLWTHELPLPPSYGHGVPYEVPLPHIFCSQSVRHAWLRGDDEMGAYKNPISDNPEEIWLLSLSLGFAIIHSECPCDPCYFSRFNEPCLRVLYQDEAGNG